MSNYITCHILKDYAPGSYNRGQDGEPKHIPVGGVQRALISGYSEKRATGEYLQLEEVRSSHLEDFIEKVLKKQTETMEIPEKDFEKLGEYICLTLGVTSWDKRTSLDEAEEESKAKSKKKTEKKNEEEKGRTVLHTNTIELEAVIGTVLTEYRENGWPKSTKSLDKKVKAALSSVRTSIAKALTGTMVTNGVLQSVDGAVQMAVTYSIDPYRPEENDWTANFTCRTKPGSDPFFGGDLQEFSAEEYRKPRAETLGSISLYSNTMYSYCNINVPEYRDNLSKNILGDYMSDPENEVEEIIKTGVPAYIQGRCEAVTSAGQHSSASHPVPIVVYIECIYNGEPHSLSWNKPITYNKSTGESVAEQGVKRVARFAASHTFDSGEIQRYVMLDWEYEDFAEEFEAAGVTVLHSYDELKTVLAEHAVRMSKSITTPDPQVR